MQADFTMTAARRINEAADGVVALPGTFLLSSVADLLDEVRQQTGITFLPQQETIGGQAIATGATGFLIILLYRLRQRQVDDGTHRGLVDAQPEGDRSYKYAHFVRHPALLVEPALILFHLSVVRDCGNPLLFQEINRLFNARDGGSIHDDGAVSVAAQSVHQQRRLFSVFTLPRHVS